MINEILTNCGIDADKANEIVKAMTEAKVYTTSLENADVRYNKLKEQNKAYEVSTKEYEKQLKDFSKSNEDVEGLKQMLEQLQLSNKELTTKHEEEMNKLQFDFALDSALTSAKSKNNKALKALLDFDSINYQEGKLNGLEEQLNALKDSSSYLFDVEVPQSTGGLGNFGRSNGNLAMTKEEFNKLNYQERNDLYRNDKATYLELSK